MQDSFHSALLGGTVPVGLGDTEGSSDELMSDGRSCGGKDSEGELAAGFRGSGLFDEAFSEAEGRFAIAPAFDSTHREAAGFGGLMLDIVHKESGKEAILGWAQISGDLLEGKLEFWGGGRREGEEGRERRGQRDSQGSVFY